MKERDSISYVGYISSNDNGNSDDNKDQGEELENINGSFEDT